MDFVRELDKDAKILTLPAIYRAVTMAHGRFRFLYPSRRTYQVPSGRPAFATLVDKTYC